MSKTRLLQTNSLLALPTAVDILNKDGLIAFPTDTVYGLAARFDSYSAIQKLFIAKGREFNKAIAVLIGDLDQLSMVCENFPASGERVARQFWPGALTIVVERLSSLPENLSPNKTIGIRIPNHPFTRQLLKLAGPLATTSANISGKPNPLSAMDVVDQMDDRIDLVLDGGPVSGGIPSTVIGFAGNEIEVFRQGAISETEIRNLFTSN